MAFEFIRSSNVSNNGTTLNFFFMFASFCKNKTDKIEKLKKTITSESLNDLIKTNSTFVDFKGKIEDNIK